ncbi:MAG: adenylate/guanylate cyclase domain-containing protein [Pseudomonadota bacterium]
METREQVPHRERYNLTAVCCDLTGSVPLARSMEPEEFAELLSGLRDLVEPVVSAHRGTLQRVDGDCFWVLFGYPHPQEDATRSAIAFALALHETLGQHNRRLRPGDDPLNFHTGISSGVVMLGAGDQTVGTYNVNGDAINLASRLCSLAGPGEITITDAALGANRQVFEVSEASGASLNGVSETVPVRRVLGWQAGVPSGQSAALQALPPLVGRAAELAWLVEVLTRPGPGALALMHARAGMGKTRLAENALRQAAGQSASVHTIQCASDFGRHDAGPAAQLANSLGVNAPATPSGDWASRLAGALQSRAAAEPTVLFIDDWHWADTEVRSLVDQLVRAPGPRPRILLSSRRADEGLTGRVPVEILTLEPLDERDVKRLVVSLSPDVDPFGLAKINRLSGGVPLLVEELCHTWNRLGDTLDEDRGGTWTDSVITARLASWPERLQSCVRAAAIIGDTVPVWLLEAILDAPLDSDLRALLAASDFLRAGRAGDTYAFRNGITRKAVQRITGRDQYRALHGRAAAALLARAEQAPIGGLDGKLAQHYSGSGDQDLAIDHAVRAGMAATGGLDEAQYFFALALRELIRSRSEPARLPEVIRQFGRACIIDPSRDQIAILEDVLAFGRRMGNGSVIAQCLYWQGFIQYGLGAPRLSRKLFVAARDAAEADGDETLLARIDGTIGQVYVADADYEAAHPALDSAIGLQRRTVSKDRVPTALVYSLACKGFALADQGNFAASETCFSEALSLLNDETHQVGMPVLTYAACAEVWRGGFERAIALTERVMPLTQQARSRYIFAIAQVINRAAKFQLHPDVAHLRDIEEATLWMKAGSHQRISLNFAYLTEGYAALGNADKARHYGVEALLRARKGDRLAEAAAYRAMARLALAGDMRFPPRRYISYAFSAANRRASERERLITQLLVHRCIDPNAPDPSAELARLGVAAAQL